MSIIQQDFPYTGMVMESIQKTPDRVLNEFEDSEVVVCADVPGTGIAGPSAPTALPEGCFIDLPPPPEVIPGKKISETINQFALFSWDGRYYPYVDESTSITYDLNSGEKLKRATTSYTYDSNGQGGTWGNPTTIKVVTDNGSNGDRHTTLTQNSYTNDATNWCLGRLTRKPP